MTYCKCGSHTVIECAKGSNTPNAAFCNMVQIHDDKLVQVIEIFVKPVYKQLAMLLLIQCPRVCIIPSDWRKCCMYFQVQAVFLEEIIDFIWEILGIICKSADEINWNSFLTSQLYWIHGLVKVSLPSLIVIDFLWTINTCADWHRILWEEISMFFIQKPQIALQWKSFSCMCLTVCKNWQCFFIEVIACKKRFSSMECEMNIIISEISQPFINLAYHINIHYFRFFLRTPAVAAIWRAGKGWNYHYVKCHLSISKYLKAWKLQIIMLKKL